MTLSAYNYNPPGVTADTLGQFDYLEHKDSGEEVYGSSPSATRVYIVNWDYRADFVDDLLGYSTLNPGGSISRVLPDEHPEIENFFAQEASLVGKGVLGDNDNGAISWTCAFIKAVYKPALYDVKDDDEISSELDRYVTRKYQFNGDMQNVQGAMTFTHTPKLFLKQAPGRIIGTIGLQYTWHEVPCSDGNAFTVPNFAAINTCFGKINSVAFDVDGFNAPVGTVLFVGVDPQMVCPRLNPGPTGSTWFWEITMSFMYRNNGVAMDGNKAGWNYFYRTDKGMYDLATNDGTTGGNKLYQTADLNTLFTL